MRSRVKVGELKGCCCVNSSTSTLLTPAIRTGLLHLLVQNNSPRKQCSMRVPVTVKIHSNGFDRYAVLQKDNRKFGNNSVYVNLRNCNVIRADSDKNTFYVSSTLSEGNSLTFQADSAGEVAEWMEAFIGKNVSLKSSCHIAPNLSPVIPRSSLLPTLTEESEED